MFGSMKLMLYLCIVNQSKQIIMLENIQINRKLVTFRTKLNKVLRTPQRTKINSIESVVAKDVYVVRSDYAKLGKPSFEIVKFEKELKGGAVCIVEYYKNKQVVKVSANIDSRFLKEMNFKD